MNKCLCDDIKNKVNVISYIDIPITLNVGRQHPQTAIPPTHCDKSKEYPSSGSHRMKYTHPSTYKYHNYISVLSNWCSFSTILLILVILIVLPLTPEYIIRSPFELCSAREVLPAIAFFNRTLYPNLVLYSGFGEKLQPVEWKQRLEREYDYQNLVAKNKTESDRIMAELLSGPPKVFRPLSPRPLLSIGIISDIQYADKSEKSRKHFRLSMPKLKTAVAEMNSNRTHLDLVVNLGDLVDHNLDTYLPVIMPVLKELRYPLYHLLGNHDFIGTEESKYKTIHRQFGMPGRYYSLKVCRGCATVYTHSGQVPYRLIMLDGNDLSLYSTEAGSHKRKVAEEVQNRNKKLNSANNFNGAIGSEQRVWLKEQLSSACDLGEIVIVFVHHTVRPDNEATSLWNAMEMSTIISSYSCVIAVISGHAHRFIYDFHHTTNHSVHYITVGGMVQSPFTSYGFVDVFEDHFRFHGLQFGRPIDIVYNITNERGGHRGKQYRDTNGHGRSTSEVASIVLEPVPLDSQQLSEPLDAPLVQPSHSSDSGTLGKRAIIDYNTSHSQENYNGGGTNINIYSGGNVFIFPDDSTLFLPIISLMSVLGVVAYHMWRKARIHHTIGTVSTHGKIRV